MRMRNLEGLFWLALATGSLAASSSSACDTIQVLLAADLREQIGSPMPTPRERLFAQPGEVWWVARHGAPGGWLYRADEEPVAAEVVYRSEWMLAIAVPDDAAPGSELELELDGAVEESGPVLLRVSSGPTPEAEPFPEFDVAMVELNRHEEWDGCGGLVNVSEVDRVRVTYDLAELPSERWGFELWNLPAEEEVVPGVSEQAIDNADIGEIFAWSAGKFEVETELRGDRKFHARFVDRHTAARGPMVEVALPHVEPPRSLGARWAGWGCSQGGVGAGVFPFVLLIVLRGYRRRTLRLQVCPASTGP